MSLMEIFSNPEAFDQLSMGEKLTGSLITMLMGMGITFIILLILWAFVAIMGRAVSGTNKKEKPAEASVAATPVATVTPEAAATSDDTVIAVITATLAAYGGGSNLVVRKISRMSGENTPWSNAAKEDCIESRRF